MRVTGESITGRGPYQVCHVEALLPQRLPSLTESRSPEPWDHEPEGS